MSAPPPQLGRGRRIRAARGVGPQAPAGSSGPSAAPEGGGGAVASAAAAALP
eukprot:CAMPEP_0194686318 /NCGR_PEP_ID=MMETSP0295-20121207/15423_1 /TAXON_ID=39354 /ORGANISM="Heterosigma akashiwo, Strain CCMP2393" /LENGTH=51 /DNA_ID=CAMNT_0039574103 /DNA_START=334 /DNA_END=487 /DNA_ORIENTATION=+